MTLRQVNGKMSVTPKPETEEYNVRNFVYVRRRPFHPRRLFDLIHDKFILQQAEEEEDQEDGMEDVDGAEDGVEMNDGEAPDEVDDADMEDAPELPDNATIIANKRAHPLFARLFRSKGEIWLATRPNQAGEWSQAGAMLTISGGRPWFAAIDKAEWESGNEEIDKLVQYDMKAGGVYGDRRQELVFIGEKLDIKALEEVFDQCLLTDEEWACWEGVMMAGQGPNTRDTAEMEKKVDELNDMFEDGFFEWPSPDKAENEHDHAGHDHSH